MDIILYESGSRGGNFDYSQRLFFAYAKHPEVKNIEWILPSSASVIEHGVQKILCDDRKVSRNRLFSQLNFLYRSFINPLILLRHLRSKEETSFVVLNDFEQLTALFWVPLYKLLLKRHHFAVVLHDPDRDAYPPSRSISQLSMKKMMSLMKFGLYHERLPDKPYYQPNGITTYLDVPHGLYEPHQPDTQLSQHLHSLKAGYQLISIPGNIRMEKNYELAIHAVSKLPGVRLIIAGSPSSSSVNVVNLKKLAADLGVAERVTFIEEYLSDEAMSAVIYTSDVVLLNYKKSFTSQSGIFNLIAPFKKTTVLSRTQSGLATIASRFNVGHFVAPDDLDDLLRVLPVALSAGSADSEKWNEYLLYASWENHVNIVINAFKTINVDAV